MHISSDHAHGHSHPHPEQPPMTREEVVALLHRYDAAKELGKL